MKKMSIKSILLKTSIFLTLFSCLRPSYFNDFQNIDLIYSSILIVAFLTTFLLYIKNINSCKFTNVVSLFFIALLIPTIIYDLTIANILFFIKTYLSIWTVTAISELCFLKKQQENFFESVSIFTLIMTVANVIFILVYGPDYLGNRTAFLGYDNTVLPFILFGALIAYIAPIYISENHHIKFKILSILNILAISASCLLVGSANAKIAVTMIALLLILNKFHILENKKISKYLNLRTYVIISVIIFFAIVVFRLQYVFEDVIVETLNRNLTITGRTQIWDLAMASIQKHPLIGTGVQDFSLRLAGSESIFHAHSTYLNIAYECGVLGLMLYFNIFRVIWKKIKDNKQSKIVAALSFIILIYFTITVIEYYRLPHTFFAILVCLYYVPKKELKTDAENKKEIEA